MDSRNENEPIRQLFANDETAAKGAGAACALTMTTTYEYNTNGEMAKYHGVPAGGRVAIASEASFDAYPPVYRGKLLSNAIQAGIKNQIDTDNVVLLFFRERQHIVGTFRFVAEFCPRKGKPDEWFQIPYDARRVAKGGDE